MTQTRQSRKKYHLDTFYLHLETLEVHYDDISCRLVPFTLDDRAIVWYHNLPPNSIQNWRIFKRIFLENFSKYKTPNRLLKELGSLKMEQKEKVKYFNQRFNNILNKFSDDTKPHDFINVDYYTFSMSINISQFHKRIVKPLLTKNYEEVISVEKYLCATGFIVDDEPTKDCKYMGKRSQISMRKVQEKEACDIENLTCIIKSLTTKVVKLKHRTSETTMGSRPHRYLQKKNVSSSSSNNN